MAEPFAPFTARLTRGYVVLAVALIALVVATTSFLAFLLYVGALNDSAHSSAQRAVQTAQALERGGAPLRTYAAEVAREAGGSRVRVLVYDDQHRLLAASSPRNPATPLIRAVAGLLGVHPAVASIRGGTIVAAPDLAGFVRLLGRYLAFVVPIGAIAVVVAWYIGRSVIRRAISPLQDVTHALRRIAAGNFTPEPLLAESSELRDLTTAYNEVAYRLTVATAERERNETQMRQFVADAGHELRTPLTIVMGYLDVLRNGVVSDPDTIARVHETMLAESRRMRASIDKLILLARLERPAPPRRERVDVAALVTRVAAELAPIAGANRISVSEMGSPPTTADADEGELYEAVKNVVENAVRYAPESPIAIDVRGEPDRVIVVVADRGPGMEAIDVAHAFDRFYRGGSRYASEGSGLGLAIAKRAVDRIGGTIALESSVGHGTRVTLALPPYSPEPASNLPVKNS